MYELTFIYANREYILQLEYQYGGKYEFTSK